MEGYLATILPWAGTFAPKNWAFCNGSILPINQNQPLYALIGSYYGGDGKTTFALPNLQSRVMVGTGQIPGLQSYSLGQTGGADIYNLSVAQMPTHTHNNTVSGAPSNITVSVAIPSVTGSIADSVKPNSTALLGKPTAATPIYSSAVSDGNLEPFNATGTVNPQVSIANAPQGGNTPIDNRPPYQAVNFIICTQGIFPNRS